MSSSYKNSLYALNRMTEQRLQERIDRVSKDNRLLTEQLERARKQIEDNKQGYQLMMDHQAQESKELYDDFKKLQEKSDKLSDKYYKLKTNYSNSKLDKTIQALNEKHQHDIGELTTENQRLSLKVQEMSMSAQQKAEMEEKLQNLELVLKTNESKHQEEIISMQRKMIRDIARIKQEKKKKLQEKIEIFKQQSLQEQHNPNAELLEESQHLRKEIIEQSQQMEKLVQRNRQLEETVKILRRDLELNQKVQTDAIRRNTKKQKEVDELSKKLKLAKSDLRTRLDSSSSDLNVVKELKERLKDAQSRIKWMDTEYSVLSRDHSALLKQYVDKRRLTTNIAQILEQFVMDHKLDIVQEQSLKTLYDLYRLEAPLDQITQAQRIAFINLLVQEMRPLIEKSQVSDISNISEFRSKTPMNKQAVSKVYPGMSKSQYVTRRGFLGTIDLPKLEANLRVYRRKKSSFVFLKNLQNILQTPFPDSRTFPIFTNQNFSQTPLHPYFRPDTIKRPPPFTIRPVTQVFKTISLPYNSETVNKNDKQPLLVSLKQSHSKRLHMESELSRSIRL